MNYIDHDGVLYTEQGTQDRLLSVLYTSRWGRCAVKLLAQPPVSELAGKLLDTGVSRFLVGPFIRLNHMDMEPYVRTQPGEFTSYNDFFTREIQKGKSASCSRRVLPLESMCTVPIRSRYWQVPVLHQVSQAEWESKIQYIRQSDQGMSKVPSVPAV